MLEVFLDDKEAVDASSSCDICSVLGFFNPPF